MAVARVDLADDVVGALSFDGAANRLCCSEDLLLGHMCEHRNNDHAKVKTKKKKNEKSKKARTHLDGSGHGAGHGAASHGLGNVVHIIECDVAAVLDCKQGLTEEYTLSQQEQQ